MKNFRFVRIIPFLIMIALISACSGGGGGSASSSTTISGVAATGVPIFFGSVTVKDKNGLMETALTDSEGNFSLDVEGFTPPFVLKAQWIDGTQTPTLFSASMQTGSVHINPLTNLALALATGSDPETVFGNTDAAPDTSGISEASLNAAVDQVQTLLDPLLDEYGITEFDPLHGSYAANPENGLDAMLDTIEITTTGGTVTIGNRLTGTVIATGSAANPEGITLDQTRFPAAAALDDIRDITARVSSLGNVMKLGENLTTADLEDFFVADPDYVTSSGYTRTQDIASIVALFGPGDNNPKGPLKELRNVRIVSDISAQYTNRGVSKVYILNYNFIYENGTISHGNNVTFGKETESGLWKFIGDPMSGASGDNSYGAVITVSSNAGINRYYSVDGGGFSGTYTAPTADGTHTVVVTNVDSTGNALSSASFTFTRSTTAGEHTLVVTDTDVAGNVISGDSYTFTLDYTIAAPTVSLTNDTGVSNTDRITSDASITVSAPAETLTRIYTVDGGAASGSYTAPTLEGPHTVVVTDTDVAGNTVSSVSYTFTLDTTIAAPTVELANDTGVSDTDRITSDASITVSTPAETVTRTYTVDGVTGSDYIAPTTEGTHTVVVTDTDVSGNAASATLIFMLVNP